MWLNVCALPGCGYVTTPDTEDAMLLDVTSHEWAEHSYIHPDSE